MVSRRDLKSAHEDAVLRQFKAHLESSGSRLEIIERPEPPEAIVELDGNCTWIEITDAFLDKEHAIGLTSSAAVDVDHVPDDGRLVLDPDATFSAALQRVINAKYDKATMQRISNAMGPGILLVGVFTPFTTAQAVAHEEAASVAKLVAQKPVQVFSTIYAYEGTGNRTFHVLYRHGA